MFDKQCWKGDQTSSKNKPICGMLFLTQTKNVGRAMFLDVTKRSNISLDKKISHVGPTMFVRLARASDPICFCSCKSVTLAENKKQKVSQ